MSILERMRHHNNMIKEVKEIVLQVSELFAAPTGHDATPSHVPHQPIFSTSTSLSKVCTTLKQLSWVCTILQLLLMPKANKTCLRTHRWQSRWI